MTDPYTEADNDELDGADSLEALAFAAGYKVLGQTNGSDNAGVLGQNSASDGTPVGVEGSVPNADGYGLLTKDDARVDGELELSAIGGSLTGGNQLTDIAGSGLSISGGALTVSSGSSGTKAALPPLDAIWSDPQDTIARLGQVFSESAWADPYARSGNSVPTGFFGTVMAPTGEVLLVPNNSDTVGVYDPATDSYRSGPSHGEGDSAFRGGALTPGGKIVFAPDESTNVGIYDSVADNYRSGPSPVDDGFWGAALTPGGIVAFAPHEASNVNIYIPEMDQCLWVEPEHGEGDFAFAGAALAPTGEVVFAPSNADRVGIYDPSADEYRSGPTHGEKSGAFVGAVLAPNGNIVFVPYASDNVGIYNPMTDSYRSGPSPEEGMFQGGTLAPTGEVVFAPLSGGNIGIFDPMTESFTSGPEIGSGRVGATLTPSGEIVLGGGGDMGIVETHAQTVRPRVTALHPLVNNS